jgi:O-antigen/teichoic acid export membrane protein
VLLRRTLLTLPAQVVGPLAQFVAAVAFTHLLGPAAFGAYVLAWAVQEFVQLVVLSWWTSYMARYLTSHGEPAARRAFDRLDLAVQAGAAVGQAALAVLALHLVLATPPSLELVAAALAFTLTRNLTAHLAERTRAEFKLGTYTALTVTGPVLGLALALGLSLVLPATPGLLLLSYGAAQALGLALAWPAAGPRGSAARVDRDLLGAAWAYGAPLMIGNALSWVGTHGVRLVVEHAEGAAAVGLVSVGWWLGLRAATFAGLLVTGVAFNVTVERIRAHGPSAARPLLALNGAMLLAVLAPTVAATALLAEPALRLMVAPAYLAETAAILPLAAAAGAIRVFRMHATDQTFLLFERPRFDILVSGVEAAGTLVLAYAGLRLGGLTGATAGCLLAQTIAAALSFFIARTRFAYGVPLSDIGRIGLAVAAMGVVLHLLPWHGTALGLAGEALLGGAAFLAALAITLPSWGVRLRALSADGPA